MKYAILAFACLLPFSALAASSSLAVCDGKTYQVTVKNGGSSRVVSVSPRSGVLREYGPVVSFQLKGQPAVTVHEPDEEYCIWSGKIKLQRIDSTGGSASGSSLR